MKFVTVAIDIAVPDVVDDDEVARLVKEAVANEIDEALDADVRAYWSIEECEVIHDLDRDP